MVVLMIVPIMPIIEVCIIKMTVLLEGSGDSVSMLMMGITRVTMWFGGLANLRIKSPSLQVVISTWASFQLLESLKWLHTLPPKPVLEFFVPKSQVPSYWVHEL